VSGIALAFDGFDDSARAGGLFGSRGAEFSKPTGCNMNSISRGTPSVWAEQPVPEFSPLTHDVYADVCIVGAGIAGLSTGYLVARAGQRVVVLDDGPIGGGQTGQTTAHLSSALDDRYYELERLHGERGARLAAESHSAAIDRIESIVAEESINCDFERLDGYLFVPPQEPTDVLQREFEAARRAGLCVEHVARVPLADFDPGPGLRFLGQAQFHPLKYLRGLAQAILREGGRIYTPTHAQSIETGAFARIRTQDGPVVTAGSVVVATNTPINDLVAIHTKQAAYLTYAIGARVRGGTVPRALFWDTGPQSHGSPAPYHYLRVHRASPAEDILIVGGEDHRTGEAGDAGDPYARLERWTRERFPSIQQVEYRWSGQVLEPFDGLAFIGRNPGDKGNSFIVSGDSGHGMTYGTIAGILLTDMIMGRANPWADLYDPSRTMLRAPLAFATHTMQTAKNYTDWLTGGDVQTPTEIPAGSGAVVRRGWSKIAAYRDPEGTLHECSAVCPHLGCIVRWNDLDKMWDCPCHGSRFDPFGKVINGPANADLKESIPAGREGIRV
jgi:glycine/D-amino acid oxidase-like deaminating enzyme/nitrite reductase/ring-hydroxylating ferredoxin subunit